MKINIACFLIALSMLACKPSPGPGPEPTPAPTFQPAPTEAPTMEPVGTPVSVVPCVGVPPDPGIYKGDCEVTEECRSNGDGTYNGKCHTRVP